MIGTIRWNFTLSAVGFALTSLLSWSRNVWTTTLAGAFYSAVLLFFIGFAVRWVLGSMARVGEEGASMGGTGVTPETSTGQAVDYTTPDDDEQIRNMLKQGGNAGEPEEAFIPMNPPKLATTGRQPEQLVQALRHMVDEKDGDDRP